MKNIDTLIAARWIVPIEPHDTYLENHAIVIAEGKILEILPTEKAKQTYQAKNFIELPTHVIMPGLINAHAHSPMTLFRGMADDLALMDWLQNHIWPAEKKWLNDEFCYDGTQLAILEMLRSGTTCFNEHFFYPESIAQAAADSGMRASVGGYNIDFPTNYANSPADYFAKAEAFLDAWQNHPLVKISLTPHAPYTISDETFLKIKALAQKYQVQIHLHLHETQDEIQQSLKQYQKRPIQRLYELGLLSPQLECVHMVHVTDEEIKLLQKTGVHIVHCPQSNLKLASGFCPVNKYLAANINVALGTDGAASNNDLDMFDELRTAALLAKAVAQDPTALNAATALRMATLNGARALGLEKITGSLASGKAADMIAVNLAGINTQPIYNPISHLVYALNSRQVTDVWVAGKQLLKNQAFTTLDENAIIAKATMWNKRILSSRH